tara:strand:- start:1066 stop:1269 length:204 start_codon:yes stop_codon:yes gene_type:complete
MSKLFRNWFDKCTNDFDSLSEAEKKEWNDWVRQQEINDAVEDQVERISRALGTNVPRGTNIGGKKWK